jgi:hypothetical protein
MYTGDSRQFSAVLAHLAVGDGVQAWSWVAGTSVLWAAVVFWLARPREGRSNLTKALGFVEFGIDDERLANRQGE